jgi:peptide/nickel transport system permease protein
MTIVDVQAVVPAQPIRRVRFGVGICLTLAFLAVLVICVVAPGILALHPPNEQKLRAALRPPVWQERGSWSYPFGTDTLGRDVYSRLVYGARTSLGIALLTVLLSAVIGVTLGILAGYFGGKADRAIMGWTDVQQGMGGILIIMVMVLTFGSSPKVIILSLGVTFWMIFARVVRARVLSLRSSSFIDSSVVIGASRKRIMLRHVLPHLSSTIISLAVLQVARILLIESGLSFLGIGVQPPDVSWGLVLGTGRDILSVAYWVATLAGVIISATVVSLTVFSRWIEPVLDGSVGSSSRG